MEKTKKLLIFADYFLPGYKAGGPIKSISSLCNLLKDKFDIYLVCRAHDQCEKKLYANIRVGEWNTIQKINVLYTEKNFNLLLFRKIIKEVRPSIIYLNSIFSFNYSILILLIIRYFLRIQTRIIIAPRGEFSIGALSLKSLKKKVFLLVSDLFNIHSGVLWHASSENEFKDIERAIGKKKIKIAPVIAPDMVGLTYTPPISTDRLDNNLRIVFCSRISKMKNLIFVCEVLMEVKKEVTFDIYGPISDCDYWQSCKKIMDLLPENITAEYKGIVKPENIITTLSRYDLFFLPTLGENYGHAIIEAMLAACPVLISNNTKWNDLYDKRAGWVFDLQEKSKFIDTIEYCGNLKVELLNDYKRNAQNYALNIVHNPEIIKANLQLFENY